MPAASLTDPDLLAALRNGGHEAGKHFRSTSVQPAMKAKLTLTVLAVVFLAAASPCSALTSIDEVSKERAKEMGVTFRTHPNGQHGVTVWMEFKATGVLKNFTGVELRMTSGGKHFVAAPLHVMHKGDGVLGANFSTDPAQLAGSTLHISVTDAPRTHIGYVFKVKDFVAVEKSR